MPHFEGIIRPFQTPQYAPPATTPATPFPTGLSVHLEIGKVGQGYTFTGSFSDSTTKYMDAKHKEDSRSTSVHRVTNPDDATQFVDVEVIDNLITKGNTGARYQKTTTEYNNTGSTPDTP